MNWNLIKKTFLRLNKFLDMDNFWGKQNIHLDESLDKK